MPSGSGPSGTQLSDEELRLDLAVVRLLARLTGGEASLFEPEASYQAVPYQSTLQATTFHQTTEPPEEVVRWIASANVSEANGVLIHAIRRWYVLGHQVEGD